VFVGVDFDEHRTMPSRKPDPCPLRRQFGENVARLRQALNITQEQLAERVGVSARYLQSVEAGEYWPSLPALVRFRSELRASWNDLLRGCDPEAQSS